MGQLVRQTLLAGAIQMPVNIGGGLNVAVPHPFLYVLEAASLIQQETCAAVTQFVKTNVRKPILLEYLCKMVCHIVRGKGSTIRPLEDVVIGLIGTAKLAAVFFLLRFGGKEDIRPSFTASDRD